MHEVSPKIYGHTRSSHHDRPILDGQIISFRLVRELINWLVDNTEKLIYKLHSGLQHINFGARGRRLFLGEDVHRARKKAKRIRFRSREKYSFKIQKTTGCFLFNGDRQNIVPSFRFLVGSLEAEAASTCGNFSFLPRSSFRSNFIDSRPLMMETPGNSFSI